MTKRATKPAMTAAQRTELLRLIKAGYAPSIAAHRAGLTMAAIAKGGARLAAEIAEAERFADDHLSALALEKGLGGDAGLLRLALERRAAAAAARAGLGVGLNDLSPAQRDALRIMVENALAQHVISDAGAMTAAERQQHLSEIAAKMQAAFSGELKVTVLRVTPDGPVEVSPPGPVAAPQSASLAAGRQDTGRADVVAPDWPNEPRGRRGAEPAVAAVPPAAAPRWTGSCEGCPYPDTCSHNRRCVFRAGPSPVVAPKPPAAPAVPFRDEHGHWVEADGRRTGPDRFEDEARQPVIAPHDWAH